MRALFAERLAVAALEPDADQPEPVYDERRRLSLDGNGVPFVARARAALESGRMTTETKVHAERPDAPEQLAQTATETRVRGERADAEQFRSGGETTTKVRGERDDLRSSLPSLETLTEVRGEHAEADRLPFAAAGFAGTQTFVQREAEDQPSGLARDGLAREGLV